MKNFILQRNAGTIAFILFLLAYFSSSGQKEAYNWYFGDHAGLDFSSGSPVAVTNGALYTDEGCSSISDANGQLLFYTNGITVYNSNHIQMPNGFMLNGNLSSSQSALIVKKPGAQNDYYIFTTDAVGGANGFCYSTVDMTLQGGLGDVVLKNQLLMTPACEHLTGTFHSNGTDVWVMAHFSGTNQYYAYLVTSAGISAPVINSIGAIHNSTSNQASMKFSPAGDRLACPFQLGTFWELMDFDNTTGILSNMMQLGNPIWSNPFSVEFSPSGRYLYAAYDPGGGVLLQFDLSLGTQAAITASAVQVGAYTQSYFGSLQLGPDKKIYAGELSFNYIGVVNDPDSPGVSCNFVDTGIYLAGKISEYGLPNFMTSYFNIPVNPVAIFSAPNDLCPGTCTDFNNLSISASSFLWSFPGANPSTSTDVSPASICYNLPGQYDVQLIATNANGSDTLLLTNYITVFPNPPPQGIAQSGDTLFANPGAVSYQWFMNGSLVAGATDYFYVATGSGDFNVVATDANGCEVEAAIFDVIAAVHFAADEDLPLIFPNPVNEQLAIQFMHHGNIEPTITIYNLLGEVLLTPSMLMSNTNRGVIDVSALANGMYWIEMNADGKNLRMKFVKASGIK